MVLAGEVADRWSEETKSFIRHLAKAKARGEPPLMRRRIEQAWRLRWTSLLTCTAARAFATSRLEMRTAHGADGATPPTHEAVADFRYAGLGGPDGAT